MDNLLPWFFWLGGSKRICLHTYLCKWQLFDGNRVCIKIVRGQLCELCNPQSQWISSEVVEWFLIPPLFPSQVNDLCWHVRCLSCSVCRTSLGRHTSCYIKDKDIFCKLDYFRYLVTFCFSTWIFQEIITQREFCK